MKKINHLTACLVLSGVITVFSTPIMAEPYQEKFDHGSMNWNSGEMSAVGIGVPSERFAKHPARARAMAVRAAKVDAQRNLLEMMQGVRIQSQTLVKDMAVESDLIRNSMQGTLRGATVVGRPHYMEDGSVEVVLAVNYRKNVAETVMDYYGQKTSPADAKAAKITPPAAVVVSAPAAITGLIIDASGKGLRTALAPRILDENGNVVYSGSMVADDKQHDIVAYDTSATDAAKLTRLGDNALTIKAIKVLDKTDVVISNIDAAKIGKAAGMQDALRNARVALAL